MRLKNGLKFSSFNEVLLVQQWYFKFSGNGSLTVKRFQLTNQKLRVIFYCQVMILPLLIYSNVGLSTILFRCEITCFSGYFIDTVFGAENCLTFCCKDGSWTEKKTGMLPPANCQRKSTIHSLLSTISSEKRVISELRCKLFHQQRSISVIKKARELVFS